MIPSVCRETRTHLTTPAPAAAPTLRRLRSSPLGAMGSLTMLPNKSTVMCYLTSCKRYFASRSQRLLHMEQCHPTLATPLVSGRGEFLLLLFV